MRCPDCSKFVSFDTEVDPEEEDSPELDGLAFHASYRRVLTCQDCGTELKESSLSVDGDLAVVKDAEGNEVKEHPEVCPKSPDMPAVHDWTLDVDAQPTTGVIDTDRRGKKIKLARYMKTTYGVEVTGTAKCELCGYTAEIAFTAEESASGFDEMV